MTTRQTEKTTQLRDEAPVETHPFEPFLPANARLLMLGTFPPAPKRWCMDWYYPNYTNDMWRIVGQCFFGDKLHFVDPAHKAYCLAELKRFLADVGIAIYYTCNRIRRTTGTASDKDLEVVERRPRRPLEGLAPLPRSGYGGPTGHPALCHPLRHRYPQNADGRPSRLPFRWANGEPVSPTQLEPRLPHAARAQGRILQEPIRRLGTHEPLTPQRPINSENV